MHSLICLLHLLVLYINTVTFLLWIWAPLGCKRVRLFITNEEQRKFFCLFGHTCHPCLWRHWYGLSDTNWQHSRSFFRDFESSKFSKQDEKSSKKQLSALSKNPPLWIGPVRLIGLGSPLSSQPHESLGAWWVTRKTLSFTQQAGPTSMRSAVAPLICPQLPKLSLCSAKLTFLLQ